MASCIKNRLGTRSSRRKPQMFDFDLTRRDFVIGGCAAGVVSLGTVAVADDRQQAGPARSPAKLHKLLVDRSIPESVRLGAYAGAIADEVFVFDGDITSLWNDELRSQWPKGPRPIAGLTSAGVHMVLEQLGRDHGARMVFSAEHRAVTGAMRHRLVGCGDLQQAPGFRGHADWVADMAKQITSCPHQRPERTSSFEYETRVPTGSSDDPRRLVTWVLAPVSPRDHGAIQTVS
jgi:hypothetical protein